MDPLDSEFHFGINCILSVYYSFLFGRSGARSVPFSEDLEPVSRSGARHSGSRFTVSNS